MQKTFNFKHIANDDSTTPAGCWTSAIRSYQEGDILEATGYIEQLRTMGSLAPEVADKIKKQMWQTAFDPSAY
jgi:hypothetical protein